MILPKFLKALFKGDEIIIPRERGANKFSAARESWRILREAYEREAANFPGEAPVFSEKAALWAAKYLFNAAQIVLIREIEDREIPGMLFPFDGKKGHSEIFSADLCLRHIPVILNFARGLAPEDPLIVHLKSTAGEWAYSATEISDLPRRATGPFRNHPGLWQEYTERMLRQKAFRYAKEETREQADIILGDFSQKLAPKWAEEKKIHLQSLEAEEGNKEA